jgi:hypothetical protein
VTTARDRELEQWLKQSGGARSAPTPDCLDAEIAGAWADGRLGGAALAEAQLHAADCARCQALMATLLRTTPAQVAAALAPKRRWLAWGMPLAAAAVVLLAAFVWVNAPGPGGQPDQIDVGPMPPLEGVAQKPDARRSPPPANRNSAAGARTPAASAPSERSRAATAAPDQVSKSKEAPGAPIVRRDSPQASFNEEPRTAAQPAVPPPQAARSTPEPQGAGANSALDKSAVQAEARRETGASADRLLTRPVAPPGSSIQVVSPNPAVQWRITGDLVERTTDSGSTWATAGALGSITSGSAPSPQVCWLAGRGGLVVRTTDGINWSRLPFPEAVDLVAVGAVNAQTATVTAADGRVFATANGGQYWLADR